MFDLPESFWRRVDKSGPCWIWTGPTTEKGYGHLTFAGKTWRVHRLVYSALVGRIPKGLTLDHVKARGCTSRACCNPAHLEPVTSLENIMRGDGTPALNARKTHCLRGHEFTRENTKRVPGGRACRACMRIRKREARSRRSA